MASVGVAKGGSIARWPSAAVALWAIVGARGPRAGCPRPTPGSADLCFLADTPIAAWTAHLAKLDIEVEEGPVARTGAQGPLTSLYVRDPDQNLIEVSVQG